MSFMLTSVFNKIWGKPKTLDKPNLESNHKKLSQVDKDGWILPLSANELLATELRQKYLNTLWQQVSMSQDMFQRIYRQPIERYAEIVQLLPASESHHHAHLGGMLDHGLEVLSFAAKLRQSYVLPQNAAPEEQSKQRDAWTAAVIYLALVHDIGKVIVDIEIHLKDGSKWLAWNGVPPMPYKFSYIKSRDYDLHPTMGSFLAHYLIPNEAFEWLINYPAAFSALMYGMAGHSDKAGLLSEITQKADKNSVSLSLGGDITKLAQKPVISFTKQLLIALRHLVKTKLKINTPKGPSDGWYTSDGVWLMSKTVADQIRAYLLEQGISVPANNPKLFDEMQSLGIIEANEEGTSIWRCRIKANSGWCPAQEFTLLKLKPEVVWENIDERLPLFLGEVTIAGADKEVNKKESEINFLEEEQNQPILEPQNVTNQTTSNEEQQSENSDVSEFLINLFDENVTSTKNECELSDNDKNSTIVIEDEPSKLTSLNEISLQASEILENHEYTSNNIMSGENFVQWLKQCITNKKLEINNTTAKLHIVKGNLFLVTPGIFLLYFQHHGMSAKKQDVEALQYSFQSLQLHRKYHRTNNDSVNFWKCEVYGPRKSSKLVGYLIEKPEYFFGKQILVDNFHLSLIEEK